MSRSDRGGGKPNSWLWVGCGNLKSEKENLPSQFLVDYVRIYDNGELQWSEYDNPFLSKS